VQSSTISLRARATGAGLGLNIWFDGQQVAALDLQEQPQEFIHAFQDDTTDHELQIELQGKTPAHTVLDHAGEIIQDAVAVIEDIALDGIQLGHAFYQHSQYHHDHNGTTQPVQCDFFGTMGCNGRVVMRFSGPVYLWLLENM
jgi:hypothetical protein